MSTKIKAFVAVIAALALLTTGTFAFNQLIKKTNEFLGQKDGVTLHDDFNPGTGQKDVYVENQSSTAMFVRVKLDEAMNLTSYTWRPSPSDWVAHTCGTEPTDCRHGNGKELFHDYFTWKMGGWKYYMPTDGSQQLVQDTTVYNGTEPGVNKTPDAKIISTAGYLALPENEATAFIGWIYDTDGYAYWSQPLLKGDSTGLLLNGVQLSEALKQIDYYYAIDVTLEAVDLADIPMWRDGLESVDGSGTTYPEATTDGKKVIDIITGISIPENGQVTIVNGNTVIEVGDTYQLRYTLDPSGLEGEAVWGSSDNNIATVDSDGLVTGLQEGSVSITLKYGDCDQVSTGITVVPEGLIDQENVWILGGNKTIEVEEEVALKYTVNPAGYDQGKTITWSSNNPLAVTVSAKPDGTAIITGIGEGTATITVTISGGDEEITHSILVTVEEGEPAGGNGELEIKGSGKYTPGADDELFGSLNYISDSYEVEHNAYIHLEDVIADGEFTNVTVTALNSKYDSFVSISSSCAEHSKPSIMCSYIPSHDEWKDSFAISGEWDLVVPIKVELERDGDTAEITINMIYNDCLITADV